MLLFQGLLLLLVQLANALTNYVEQANITFDISLVKNSSSNGVDFHITMASHFGPKGGWVALGTGHAMKGSLMFVMYPTDDKSVSLSVQKASGHAQPKKSSQLPTISMLNSLSTDTDGVKVEFVCYACDQWPAIDVTNSAQQFIWAKREANVMSETILGIHSDLGFLEIDMKQAFTDSVEQSSSNLSAKPVITAAEPNIMLHYVRTLHGVVLGASFMAFYPIGAAIIHYTNFKNAFRHHWVIQLSITVACFLTVIMGLVLSGNGVEFRNFSGIHQILGATVFCCLILQALMGYLHHLNYLRLMRRTWASHGHIWLGKLVLALGIFNTKLGLDYFGAPAKTLLLWWVCLGLYVSCLLYIVVRRAMKNRKEAGRLGYTLLNV